MSVLFDGNFPAFDIIGRILAREVRTRDKTTSSLLPTSVPFAVSTTSAGRSLSLNPILSRIWH